MSCRPTNFLSKLYYCSDFGCALNSCRPTNFLSKLYSSVLAMNGSACCRPTNFLSKLYLFHPSVFECLGCRPTNFLSKLYSDISLSEAQAVADRPIFLVNCICISSEGNPIKLQTDQFS